MEVSIHCIGDCNNCCCSSYVICHSEELKYREIISMKKTVSSLAGYSIVFLIIIMAVYIITDKMQINEGAIAGIFTLLAFVFIAYIYNTKPERSSGIKKP